jgi:exopolyphosphatase/guanosine-5'-triphosphate,3'-diphosphate pyrophosphatase
MKFGAIDIGTNAARLLVGEVTKEGNHSFVKKISYTRIPLRLGEDVFDKGIISEKKLQNFIKTIQAFKLISEIFNVKELRACATSAMREASNNKEVIDAIKTETGIEIEVISGDEEARLIFGTFFLLDFDKTASFLVIDVGGGSTEISVFEGGNKVAAKSFQLGTIRLLKEKTDKKIWKELNAWIEENVDLSSIHSVYATGGNINKVHKILGCQQDEQLSLRKMNKLREELDSISLEERIDKFQLKPDRADVIIPAIDIYSFILKKIKTNQVFVPKIGLSDGMIYELHLKGERLILKNKKIRHL